MPHTKKPHGIKYSKSRAFIRNTEIPILQLNKLMIQILLNLICNKIIMMMLIMILLIKSIRVQLKDALIELKSQCNVEENICLYVKCYNNELFKIITIDCIYFEHEIKKQFNLYNCEQSNLAVALTCRGLFSASPINPLIAFEIKLLEFAEKLLLLAQISYESFCIALRHIHDNKLSSHKNIYKPFMFTFRQYILVKKEKIKFLTEQVVKKPEVFCPAYPLKNSCNSGSLNRLTENDPCMKAFKVANEKNSKILSNALDISGVVGITCKHGIPMKFLNIKTGESVISIYSVSVFHAYAHEAFCQCIYHSRKREGFGLTDALDHFAETRIQKISQTLIKQYQHALELKEISQKDLEKLELQNYFLDIIKSS
ncbi:unnamed protein product [Rhizophagus irregularis]|uniref:CxC1-like cysteine cluster associated with KDZ transposases domain-containing protein n=1 Tax=Rhizophagus irregularis TaxID=588596 RepID=A0A916EIV0_9GLOM|nr:unnamed protein product [Rhizophagus irregularis]